jgi:Holliday junction DNA helicase RuvA
MIGMLKGAIAAIGEDSALIDVNGVGYVVQAGARTLARLSVGDAAIFYVETQVREDSIRLFGFLSEEERSWFAHLQSAPGVGAKVALNILDALPPAELADAIALKDTAAISRANGVGPKLAARIAQELSGKTPARGFLAHAPSPAAPAAKGGPAPATRGDAVSALVNLGIEPGAALRAVASAMKTFSGEPPAPELIRAALKEVSR